MRYKYCQAGECMSTGLYYCKDCYEQLKSSIPEPEKLTCSAGKNCEQDPSLHICEGCHTREVEELKKFKEDLAEKEETISRLKKKIELLEWRIKLSSKENHEKETLISTFKKQNQERKSKIEVQLKQVEEQEAQLKSLAVENDEKEAQLQNLQQQSEENNRLVELLLTQKSEADEKIKFLRKWQIAWAEKSDDPCEIVLRAVDGGALRVNRSVLASKSEAFSAMLSSNMMEGARGCIELEDLNTPALVAFARFLHIAEVSLEDLSLHAPSLYRVAHGYGIELLQPMCEEFLLKNMDAQNVFGYLETGHLCDSTKIQDASFALISSSSQFQNLKLNGEWLALCRKYPELSMSFSNYLLQQLKS